MEIQKQASKLITVSGNYQRLNYLYLLSKARDGKWFN